MSARYDAIVVGGGHNGLVAAGYLAREGLKVLVLERRNTVGGPCCTMEYFPGFRGGYSNSPGSLEPKVVRDMALEQFGLEFVKPDPYVVHPFRDGRCFVAWRDRQRMTEEIAVFSRRDAHAYHEIFDFFLGFAHRLGVSLFAPPPSLTALMSKLTSIQDEEAFAKIFFGSIKDLLDQRLESEEMKAVLTMLSLVSNLAGPRTPGTPYMLLHRPLSLASREAGAGYDPRTLPLRGSTGLPRGGMGAITQAMARSIQASGAEVRVEAAVTKLIVAGHLVKGVVLATGEEIRANIILSNLNPKTTFLDLIEAGDLSPAFRENVRALSMDGSQFKVGLALDDLPRFAGAKNSDEIVQYAGCQFRIGASVDDMESAWDDAKYGRWSRAPMIWGLTPSVTDPTMAPAGKHIMSLNINHAPYELSQGDWETERETFGKHCIDVLSEYIPNLKDIIIDYRFWSPRDIANELGLVGANITHGDMLPGTMFSMRPLAGWSDYRTPLGGLYLCGVGSWPGGYVSGIPGHNAAQQVLNDLQEGVAVVYERIMREGRPGV